MSLKTFSKVFLAEYNRIIPRLKSKNGKGFPEEGEVGAEGLWFRRVPREAKKTIELCVEDSPPTHF